MQNLSETQEARRLQEAREHEIPWGKWGPYLSERQWGTVREDYSANGDAWDYFTHDQARSRAYRWGEDGLAGLSDDKQRLCLALALWNGRDPIIKERLFGVTNSEGNHGEDVKEYYFYLDSTPTHSYLKFLYKYPQGAFPYDDLVRTNRQRTRDEYEYELLDTGVFDDDRYFDVFVEYAKSSPEDILMRLTVCNRGPEAATLHVLPTLWFRQTWSGSAQEAKPALKQLAAQPGLSLVGASHAALGEFFLYCEGEASLLFTENETNNARVFGTPNLQPYVKDAFHNYLVHGQTAAVNPDQTGTKAAALYRLEVPAGGEAVLRLRLSDLAPEALAAGSPDGPFGQSFEAIMEARRQESDEFYACITPPAVGEDAARVMRQALAGMLWSKQYYYFDAITWLGEHGVNPLLANSHSIRNQEWFHMVNDEIISMPDKWEYPWYAAWDLAFQSIPLALVDIDFAKKQLDLMLREFYIHPSGQLPAYEWNFSDVNPPVHAWAALLIYKSEKVLQGKGDIQFLKHVFGKLMLNFTWWVNRKDRFGKNVFEGGFLGLDNIGVFDRSAALPTGGRLEQADGTAWMAFYCQSMLDIALELAPIDPVYINLAVKFLEHFLWIASAINRMGGEQEGLWDEEDGFYYDLLRYPDGTSTRLKVRSVVGLLPLCATVVFEKSQRDLVPQLADGVRDRIRRMPELLRAIHPIGPEHRGVADRGLLALVGPDKLRRILAKMLDENEFLSPYGIRSLSRYHAEHPYIVNVHGEEYRVDYLPAESNTGMFGGNSNWRGPIWFPMNSLIIRALVMFYLYYGDNFKVECPTGSGNLMNLFEVTQEIVNRLTRIFLRDEQGRRPVYGGAAKFQNDPHWRDYLLFYEYFHGDNGAGLGASHQTGWTGFIAKQIQFFGLLDANFLARGRTTGIFYPEST
ncbi:MAG: MGH1-like glycoside hydrolase domain-containing protein [Desulfobaccales bacterium]